MTIKLNESLLGNIKIAQDELELDLVEKALIEKGCYECAQSLYDSEGLCIGKTYHDPFSGDCLVVPTQQNPNKKIYMEIIYIRLENLFEVNRVKTLSAILSESKREPIRSTQNG